jgi:hypothetical protein
MITLCAHPFKLAICFSRAMPHLYAFHTLPHSRALRVPHSMLTSSTNTSCPCYSSVVPPPSTACPPPNCTHSLPPSTAARPALPPPTAAHAAVRTRHRRHCSAVERNPPNRPVPGTAGFSISRLTGPVCIFLAGNSAGRLGQPAPTNCNFTAPATASSKHSPRLESSTRVLDSSPRQPDHAPFFLPTPTPPSLASCVTQALQPGDLLQLSGEDQSTCPACGHLCPPSSPEAPWQGQSGSGQCSTAKQRNGTLHSWAFRQ